MKQKKTAFTNSFSFSKKPIVLFLMAILFYAPLMAQKYSIDYYGIMADGLDDNTSKMTSDLYYTQLSEINSYTVSDKRESNRLLKIPDSSTFNANHFSFYAVISKAADSDKWIRTISLYDGIKKTTSSESKEYDSYYKILVESKSALEQTISQLLSKASKVTAAAAGEAFSSKTLQSTEFLSGTWGGEDSIDKIVIMRGGRGFVIFKNGASMNITVEIKAASSGQNIVITQSGKSNASFLTELPRDIALKEAVNAQPIKWVFMVSDDDTLIGTKNTLILSDGNAENGSLAVTWKRKS